MKQVQNTKRTGLKVFFKVNFRFRDDASVLDDDERYVPELQDNSTPNRDLCCENSETSTV